MTIWLIVAALDTFMFKCVHYATYKNDLANYEHMQQIWALSVKTDLWFQCIHSKNIKVLLTWVPPRSVLVPGLLRFLSIGWLQYVCWYKHCRSSPLKLDQSWTLSVCVQTALRCIWTHSFPPFSSFAIFLDLQTKWYHMWTNLSLWFPSALRVPRWFGEEQFYSFQVKGVAGRWLHSWTMLNMCIHTHFIAAEIEQVCSYMNINGSIHVTVLCSPHCKNTEESVACGRIKPDKARRMSHWL